MPYNLKTNTHLNQKRERKVLFLKEIFRNSQTSPVLIIVKKQDNNELLNMRKSNKINKMNIWTKAFK